MRVEMLKKELDATGQRCVVLNTGPNRRVPSPHYETVVSGIDYCKKLWRYARRGYLVHAHVNGESVKGLIVALVAELLATLAGTRCVLTFHAGVDQAFFPRGRAWHLFPAFKLMFALPDAIICNTAAVKAKLMEYGPAGSRIHCIPAFSRQYLNFDRVPLPAPVEDFVSRTPRCVFTYVRIREGFYLDTLLDGFAQVAAASPDVGMLFVGVTEDVDPGLWKLVEDRIATHGLARQLCIVDELDHDQFLTALTRSVLYLRTPTTDGAASSVLESLALGVPVVAAENGTRPAGVVTYRATDPEALAHAVNGVLRDPSRARQSIPPVEIRDTISDEIRLLAASSSGN
jgi:glycosyltransferase involved in cell wall biosynthesis